MLHSWTFVDCCLLAKHHFLRTALAHPFRISIIYILKSESLVFLNKKNSCVKKTKTKKYWQYNVKYLKYGFINNKI